MMTTVLAVLLPLAALAVSVLIACLTMKKTGSGKKAFRRQFLSFGLA